mmetsp:Transcript_119160/g.282752  ORF Transcript_119160/g.282752 Transcript_119160/m.282752 type:complete len:202 (-) Transcript_119160:1182-1787(-)
MVSCCVTGASFAARSAPKATSPQRFKEKTWPSARREAQSARPTPSTWMATSPTAARLAAPSCLAPTVWRAPARPTVPAFPVWTTSTMLMEMPATAVRSVALTSTMQCAEPAKTAFAHALTAPAGSLTGTSTCATGVKRPAPWYPTRGASSVRAHGFARTTNASRTTSRWMATTPTAAKRAALLGRTAAARNATTPSSVPLP